MKTRNSVFIFDLKEMRLHDAEVKVKSLEKDNARLREHEEFYINKLFRLPSKAKVYLVGSEQFDLE